MSDVEGPAVDALRAELKEVQSAAAVPTLDVQIEQYESFISRSQRKLTELDKQRVAEEELLTETRACPDMPTLILAELDDWMKARQGDLQGALEFQETERVLELTSKLSDAAVGMMEMSGKMVP